MPNTRFVLNRQSRELVVRLSNYFEREMKNGGPLTPLARVQDRVAEALGIGHSTVTRIVKEKYGPSGSEDNLLRTPNKKRCRKMRVRDLDSFAIAAIRNHIYEYYRRNEFPTLDKLLVSLRERGLFSGKKSSLRKVLHDVGFTYKKSDKRKLLMERTDIALKRCQFLREIKKVTEEEWKNVVFLDETWLNANHTVPKYWTDDTKEASTKVPIGKGERLIICHAGNAGGFIDGALMAFQSKKTSEYHEEMDAVKFEEWFQGMLLTLKEPSVIIMDNASYHSRQVDKAPTQASKKQEIIDWLVNKNIEANSTMLKVELLHLVKLHMGSKVYVTDQMALEHGHRVIRSPPYHCHFNAIELIWAQVKGYAARCNTAAPFTGKKMMGLLEQAVSHVTSDDWAKVVQKTKNAIAEEWERDIRYDSFVENRIIINTADDSSDDDSTLTTSSSESSDEE